MKKYIALILTGILFSGTPSILRGGEEVYSSYLRGNDIRQGARLTIAYPMLSLPGQELEYSHIRVKLYLAEDRNSLHNIKQAIIVHYTLSATLTDNTVRTFTYASSVYYDDQGTYYDLHVREYNEASFISATLTIDEIRVGTATPDLIMELQLIGKRSCSSVSLASAHPEHSYTANTNEMVLTWDYIGCAESYDVEWLFVDNPYHSSEIPYDFKNATRINTTRNHYRIPLAYPKGSILYRVRGVGRIRGESFPGPWSGAASGGDRLPSSFRYDYNGLEQNLNWQYTSLFSENGKRKEVVTFYDGTFRNRQQVTVFNSRDVAVVGETFYDHVGRPALQSIPAPTANRGIRYYGARGDSSGLFNGSFEKSEYDTDSRIGNPSPFPPEAGSFIYHSPQNPFLHQSRWPNIENTPGDPEGYLYTHTRYRNDGTERIHSVSTPGSGFQLGSGKETRYYYGNPFQGELDRLFGNEVGYATHYQKIVTLDPNSMVTVSYYDMQERLIATSLSTGGEHLMPVDGAPQPETLSETTVFDDDSREYSRNITVSGTDQYTFVYNFDPADPLTDRCQGATGTMPCYYRVIFKLWDPDKKQYLFEYDRLVNTVTEIKETLILGIGSYQLYKSVTVSDAYLADMLQQYRNRQDACVPYFHAEPEPCYTVCEEYCMEALKLEKPDYEDPAFVQCIEECENPIVSYQTECEAKYASMLRDMSPGGQYFDNRAIACPPDSNESEYAQSKRNDFLSRINEADLNYNSWIQAMLRQFGLGTAGAQRYPKLWDSLRLHWQESYAVEMFAFHPEKPMYDFFCACGDTAAQRKWENLFMNTKTLKEAINAGLLNPLDLPTDEKTGIMKDDYSMGYMPFESPSPYPDPYFKKLLLCCKGMEAEMLKLMISKMYSYFNWEDENGIPWYASIWYFLFDPESISQGYGPDVRKEVRQLFTSFQLETLPYMAKEYKCTPDDARWLLFRNLYLYLKKEVQSHFFRDCAQLYVPYKEPLALDQSEWHAGSYPASALGNCDLFLFADPDCQNKPLTKEGYEIRFLCNPLFGLNKNNYDEMRHTALQELNQDCLDNCDAYADEWMRQLADFFSVACPEIIPENAQWNDLKLRLINLCHKGCYNALAEEDFSRKQLLNISEYLDLMKQNCKMDDDFYSPPLIVYPRDEEHYINCGCDNYQAYLNNYRLTFWSSYDEIEKALKEGDISMDYKYWTEFCKKERYLWMLEGKDDITLWDLYNFPRDFRCYPPNSSWNKLCSEMARLNAEAQNARNKEEALDSAVNIRAGLYPTGCMARIKLDRLDISYANDEYLYTLYYYDQAGNLVKTVPPKGVSPIQDVPTLDKVRAYRETVESYENMDGFIHPQHSMAGNYRYNTLDQPIEQSIPDHKAPALIFYDILSRPVFSQNAWQKELDAYAYNRYDALGRIIESGTIRNSGPMNAEIAADTAKAAGFINQADYRIEVTKTVYDQPLVPSLGQRRLRNRIAAVTFADTYHADPLQYRTATHYSYDVQGNVKQLVQNIKELADINMDTLRIDYEYDLISGNVNKVSFRKGPPIRFIHRYRYDEDNRITHVYTSENEVLWHADARYFYYPHGPLARTETGEKQVQGTDYAYTLNGWMKAVNSILPKSGADPGKDGLPNTSHGTFPGDAFAFSLQYFKDDYKPLLTPDIPFWINYPHEHGLFNGNIAASAARNRTYPPLLKYFRYDKLNRIKEMSTATLEENSIKWGPLTYSYFSQYQYDFNGNILFLQRMDRDMKNRHQLMYQYAENQNRLASLESESEGRITPSEYVYDAIGNLIEDRGESTLISWNSAGKVSQVKNNDVSVIYRYSPTGQRQVKETFTPATGRTSYQYYIHDASGNVMAILNDSVWVMTVYGSQRLGETDPATQKAPIVNPYYQRAIGKKRYEFTDHLGNVNAVVSDRKTELYESSSRHLLYRPVYLSVSDYYPFGFPIEERSSANNDYRYGFNGQEKDNEIYGEGASYTAEFWQYDARLGRRWNVDPEIIFFPNKSSYSTFSNNPLIFIDPSGDVDFYFNGSWIGTDGRDDNLIAIVRSKQLKREILKRTKKGIQYDIGILDNGSKGVGYFVIHSDILVEANKILSYALTEGLNKEFGSVLKQINNNFKVTERNIGDEINLAEGVIASVKQGSGDVSIHSHLTGTIILDGRIFGASADASTEDELGEFSDEVSFPNYKMNIVVGKEGNAFATEYEGAISEGKRANVINIYGKYLSKGKIGKIYQKEVNKLLFDNNSKLKKRYELKNKK